MSPLPRTGEQGGSGGGKVNTQDETVKVSRTPTSHGSLPAPTTQHENKTKKKRKFCCSGWFSWKKRKEKRVLTQSRERREKEVLRKMTTVEEGEESDAFDHQSLRHEGNTPERLTNGIKSQSLKNSRVWQRLRKTRKATGKEKNSYLKDRDLQREGKTRHRTNRYSYYGYGTFSAPRGKDSRDTKRLKNKYTQTDSHSHKMVTRSKHRIYRNDQRMVNSTSSYTSDEEIFLVQTRDTVQEKKGVRRGMKCCMFLCFILAALAFAWTVYAFSEEIYYSIAIIPPWEPLRVSLIGAALLWVCACFVFCCLRSGLPLRTELFGAFILVLFNMSLVYVTRHFSPYLDRFRELEGWWLVSLLTPLLFVACFTCFMTTYRI
ncbi:hypothetical protein E2C01_077160 [Portunus trituberculatus]|uniref:Uncharacterized protein n=1 Tax=Portunus trituberculatus TaxID=210409 RepID=A0A5B7IDN1_PORTR|nr:hypothetical protein [Portunus trituberculatus]